MEYVGCCVLSLCLAKGSSGTAWHCQQPMGGVGWGDRDAGPAEVRKATPSELVLPACSFPGPLVQTELGELHFKQLIRSSFLN